MEIQFIRFDFLEIVILGFDYFEIIKYCENLNPYNSNSL